MGPSLSFVAKTLKSNQLATARLREGRKPTRSRPTLKVIVIVTWSVITLPILYVTVGPTVGMQLLSLDAGCTFGLSSTVTVGACLFVWLFSHPVRPVGRSAAAAVSERWGFATYRSGTGRRNLLTYCTNLLLVAFESYYLYRAGLSAHWHSDMRNEVQVRPPTPHFVLRRSATPRAVLHRVCTVPYI
jgi:hypothetical protein